MTNKELSRRIFDEIYTAGKLGLIEETHDEHCRLRDPSRDTVLEGPEAIRQYVKALRAGFPDFTIEVDRQVAEDDHVATQAICHGTHAGPFLGLEPTNRKIHVRCSIFQRCRDGKVVEVEVMWDTLWLLNQAGVAPAQALYEQLMASAREEPRVEA